MSQVIRGKTIVYFGPEPWEGLWRNRHQLMSRFAANNNVWYIEPATPLRRLFSGRKFRTRLTSRDRSGVNVFHSPWWLPIVGREPFKSLTLNLYLGIIKRRCTTAEGLPIVWVSRPRMIDYVTRMETALTIYHVVDEYSGYGSPSEQQRSKLQAAEKTLLQRVDMTIVVTQSLCELKSEHNANTHIVENAADFAAYADSELSAPTELDAIPRPIIGYTGLIAARLDLAMLIEIASARPDWSFVFVGSENDDQCQSEMQRLKSCANVHLLGQKTIEETPRYVASFDVSIIPYAVNLRAQHASPLKLFEYAAASKPIVTTDFAAAQKFAGQLFIARDSNEFLRHCESALKMQPTDSRLVENRRIASNSTWEARVEQISKLIETYIES